MRDTVVRGVTFIFFFLAVLKKKKKGEKTQIKIDMHV